MAEKSVQFKDWLTLSSEEQKKIYELWNRYKGEGEHIIKDAYKLLKQRLANNKDVVDVSYGIYHGGDWAICITLRVGYDVSIPDKFCGIMVVKLYEGLNGRLSQKLTKQYQNNIERFVEGEIEEFKKCFDFTAAPHAKEWLVDFVRRNEVSGSEGTRSLSA